jgi:hypothetical protein
MPVEFGPAPLLLAALEEGASESVVLEDAAFVGVWFLVYSDMTDPGKVMHRRQGPYREITCFLR